MNALILTQRYIGGNNFEHFLGGTNFEGEDNIDKVIESWNRNVPKGKLKFTVVPDNEIKKYHPEIKLQPNERLVLECNPGIYYSILKLK